MASNQRNLIPIDKKLSKLFPTEPLDSYKVVNTSVKHILTLEVLKSGPLSVLNKKHKWKEYHVVLYDQYVLMYQEMSSEKPKRWFNIKNFIRANSDKDYTIMLVNRDTGINKSFATTSFRRQKIWVASFQAMVDKYLYDGNIYEWCSDIIIEHLYAVQQNDSANGTEVPETPNDSEYDTYETYETYNIRQGTMEKQVLPIKDRQSYDDDDAYITDFDTPGQYDTRNSNIVSDAILVKVSNHVGDGWKHFGMLHLGLRETDIFRCKSENINTSEKIFAMLSLWRKHNLESATMEELVHLLKKGKIMDHELYDSLKSADIKKTDYVDTFTNMPEGYRVPYENTVSHSDKRSTPKSTNLKITKSFTEDSKDTTTNVKWKLNESTHIGTTTGRQGETLSERSLYDSPRRQESLSKLTEETDSCSKLANCFREMNEKQTQLQSAQVTESTAYQWTHKHRKSVKPGPPVAKKPSYRNRPMSQ